MKAITLVEKLIDIAKNYKTLYVMGCIGANMTAANKVRYTTNHSYNKKADRTAMIKAATADTWGFDCVCLIKSVLWGWSGDASKNYGGAKYGSNGVPDINADAMIKQCADLSTDFSKIEVGEAVWCKGHIGVYIGDGLAVECTPSWKNCVQITACNCNKAGYNRRNWTKHGKLPYVEYTKTVTESTPVDTPLTFEEVVKLTLNGHYGNGAERKRRIPAETKYTYEQVQAAINAALKTEYFPKYTGLSLSIVSALKSLKIDSSYDYRAKIAAANSITGYKGSAIHNIKLFSLLKQGKLIKP